MRSNAESRERILCLSFFYLLAIEVGISSERTSGPGEGEHGQRDGDRYIHPNLHK